MAKGISSINYPIFALIAAILMPQVNSGNIGMFVLGGSASHTHIFYVMAEDLIARGHNVTFYTIFKPKVQLDGLTQIFLKDISEIYQRDFMPFFNEDGPVDHAELFSNLTVLLDQNCRRLLQSNELKELLAKNDKIFDVSITDGFFDDCTLPILDLTSRSLIYTVSTGQAEIISWLFNVPAPPSYVTSLSTPVMNFSQRIKNLLAHSYLVFIAQPGIIKNYEDASRELLPPGLPTVSEVHNKISLFFINGHPATNYIVPSLPFVRYLGGLTVKEPKPLPKDLEEFMNGSGEHGVILVSFGSIVTEDMMPRDAKRALVEAFSRIPQRVIWKYRGELPGLSPNVKLVDWMPQQAILAHPKTRGFLTHGGHMSLTESIYYGVPLVGMPVFMDQPMNMMRAEDFGIAVTLEWRGITSDKVLEAITTVTTDKSYKTRVMERRKIFRDNLVNPREEAVYWIEYLIRHPGTLHLRPQLDHLNLAQYLLLDVIALIVLIIAVITYVTYRLIRTVLRLIRGTSKKSDKKKN